MSHDPSDTRARSTVPQSVPQRNRRSIRLRGYDYSRAGAYFVTICTQNRECLFGEIMNGEMRLNDAGRIVVDEWLKTAEIRAEIELDEWVVMPNHFHGKLVIADRRGTARRAPTVEQFGRPVSGSIPTIIRSFKSAVTKRINDLRLTPGAKLWQRNYWEHIVRNEPELNRIREYIHNNPAQWKSDQLYGHGVPCPIPDETREPVTVYGKEAWML
jgi:putative transposase